MGTVVLYVVEVIYPRYMRVYNVSLFLMVVALRFPGW